MAAAKEMAKQIRLLARREWQKRMFKKIAITLNPISAEHGALSTVWIPSGHIEPYPSGPDPKTWAGEWSPIYQPEMIAAHVCAANRRQYNQAMPTPFGSGPLANYVGMKAETDGAQIPKCLATPLILPHQDLQVHIKPEEFIATYKIVQEQTSSSPSGRHVGHYKAILDDPELVSLHATMMSLPFQVGFSPERRHQVVDVMLEKQPRNTSIHRLRIVALLESDFNQANRIILARQLGFWLEDNRLVSDMQFGSRPGKQCVSAILHKQLSFDIVRHSKETAAFIENDAIGCYDRMVNSILVLAMRRLGIPSTATASLAATWEKAIEKY